MYNIPPERDIIYRNDKGEIHRDNDEPAYINEGYLGWYKNGILHREAGPAQIFTVGNTISEFWVVDGISYDKPETMPHFLYVNYLRWEYRKKNGI